MTLDKNDLYRLRRKFHNAGNMRDVAIFEILYNTGVRVSELCSLELDDIKISERKGTIIVRHGKGGKYREIPLNKEAREAIAGYLDVRPACGSQILLIGERGPMTRSGVFRILQKYARNAGIEEVGPHTLRHQFGKELVEKGEDLVKVACLMEHSDVNTTAIYAKPTEEDLIYTVEKVGQF